MTLWQKIVKWHERFFKVLSILEIKSRCQPDRENEKLTVDGEWLIFRAIQINSEIGHIFTYTLASHGTQL